MSIYFQKHIELLYVSLNINRIITSESWNLVYGGVIWKIVRIPLNVGTAARTIVIHEVLIYWIKEKKMDIREGFPYEKD